MNTRWLFLVLFFIPIYGMDNRAEEGYNGPIVSQEEEQWIEWCDSIDRLRKLSCAKCSFEYLWLGNVITFELINEIGNKVVDVQSESLKELLEDCYYLQEIFIKRCADSSWEENCPCNFNGEVNYAIK